MKKTYLAVAAALALSFSGVHAQELKTDEQKLGYAIGMDMLASLEEMGVLGVVDKDALVQGLRDAMDGKTPALTQDEVEKIFEAYMEKRAAEMEAQVKAEEEARQKAGEEQKQLGKAFLEENKTKEGVKTTASGLQYKVITEGTGAKPTAEDEVEVKYKGTLISGEVFDESKDQTVSFPLKFVIAGWTEGLQLMSEGSKYMFYIPSELAYGTEGAGDDILPNATLIFEVELVKVIKTEKQPEKK